MIKRPPDFFTLRKYIMTCIVKGSSDLLIFYLLWITCISLPLLITRIETSKLILEIEVNLNHCLFISTQSYQWILFCYLDNDQPVLTPSVASPVEGIHNVTFTCSPRTSDNVTGYLFYKNNVLIYNTTNSHYSLPNNSRIDDGSYTCEVTTNKAPTSPKAHQVAVMFLCKLLQNRISEF